ncbi:MAG: hypothetical protein CSH36_08465, partial [Thalassolituus sp.]
MDTHFRHRLLLGTLFGTFLLAGCSGSSGSGSDEPTPVTPTPQAPATTESLSGTAAIGAAITDGTVTAICSDGTGFTEAVTTDANGNWSGEVTNGAMPCALQVTGGNPPVTLHSYATTAGTVNITPLTDMIMASATGQTPADWFANFDGTPVDTSTASTSLLNSFAAKGFDIPAAGNPMTTPFVADGTGWDGLLDDIGDAIDNDPAIDGYDALVTLIRDGNLANLPAPPPAEMFSISGTISGATGTVIWETRVAGSIVRDGGDSNGTVVFSPAAGIGEGSNWSVVINTAPAGQTCLVTDGNGTLTADVDNVAITCADIVVGPTNYSISGTVAGASGPVTWELRKDGAFHNDGSATNGAVTFTGAMVSGSTWAVSINSSPTGQTCSVSSGSGTLNADVSNVSITCEDEVVTPPPAPGETLYDFSTLNLDPELPAGFTPIAPDVSPLDPSSNIASLYAQLAAQQQDAIFAPVPAGLTSTVTSISTGTSYDITEATPTHDWVRITQVSMGIDGVADTHDDYIISYSISPFGYLGVSYGFDHPGADGQWYT